MGSGDDVDMDDETIHGHGHGMEQDQAYGESYGDGEGAYGGMDPSTGYLPVYLGTERYGWN